jgi:hypothetical protein
MKVFISHGARDAWIARQMARCIADLGAGTFIDIYDIATGDEFETRIRHGLAECDELLALFTPLSIRRAWVFMEIGAAWVQGKRVSAILYGLSLQDFDSEPATGAGLLAQRHVRDLNDFDQYLRELKNRCDDGR